MPNPVRRRVESGRRAHVRHLDCALKAESAAWRRINAALAGAGKGPA